LILENIGGKNLRGRAPLVRKIEPH